MPKMCQNVPDCPIADILLWTHNVWDTIAGSAETVGSSWRGLVLMTAVTDSSDPRGRHRGLSPHALINSQAV